MKKLSTVLAIVTVLSLVFSITGIATGIVVWEDNFGTTESVGIPGSWNQYQASGGEVEHGVVNLTNGYGGSLYITAKQNGGSIVNFIDRQVGGKTTGKVKISFEARRDAVSSPAFAGLRLNATPFVSFNDLGHIQARDSTSGLVNTGTKYTANQWYKVDVIIDLSNDNLVVTHVDDNEIYRSSFAPAGINPLNRIMFGYQGNASVVADRTLYIDNVSVTEYASTTAAAVEKVSFTKDGGIYDGATAPEGADGIDVFFATPMTVDTINGTNILLKDKMDGDSVVDCTVTYDTNKLVCRVTPAKALRPGGRYELTVTGDVKDISGVSMTTPYVQGFDVAGIAANVSITKNGVEVTDFSDLSTSDAINVKAEVVNKTGEAHSLALVYAEYSNNQLVRPIFKVVDITNVADSQDVFISDVPFALGDTSEIDMIKVFLWASDGSIQPICSSAEIK